jgi:hypothetical protein
VFSRFLPATSILQCGILAGSSETSVRFCQATWSHHCMTYDTVSSSDGGPIALNGWIMVNNELVGCEIGGRSLICGTML